MTVATQDPSANPWGALAGAGQEDVKASDLKMPRLNISGPKGAFVSSTSGAEFGEMDCIVLGVVKQRAAFHPVMDDKDKRPICKSNDFSRGFPSELSDRKSRLFFPLEKAGYYQGGPLTADAFGESNGLKTIECDGCQLKEWDAQAKRTKGCDEVHTYIVLIIEGDSLSPATFGLKRSQIAASKAYISSFAQAQGRPMFTAVTHIKLEQRTKGTVTYAVPIFRADMSQEGVYGNPTLWAQFFEQYNDIRDMIRSDPRPRDDEEQAQPQDNSWGGGAPQAQPEQNPWAQYADQEAATLAPQAQTAPAPSPGLQADPWATGTVAPDPTPAPQVTPAPAPAPQATPPSVPPVAAPTPAPAPQAQATPPVAAQPPAAPPVAPPPVAAPPAAASAPPVATAPAADDDDLPF